MNQLCVPEIISHSFIMVYINLFIMLDLILRIFMPKFMGKILQKQSYFYILIRSVCSVICTLSGFGIKDTNKKQEIKYM